MTKDRPSWVIIGIIVVTFILLVVGALVLPLGAKGLS